MPDRPQPPASQGADTGTRPEPSDYQQAAREYYDKMRATHTRVYCSDQRIEEELQDKRYHDVTPAEIDKDIRNLGTFAAILHRLCGSGEGVRGIDFGCGSSWFVDFVRRNPEYRWSAVGYDPDESAIELARWMYPHSAEYYQCLDPVRDGLPQKLTATQAFVFCNAVLQHFDVQEADIGLAEMSRVLRPGGICMLIFKHWPEELLGEGWGMDGPAPRILDAAQGKVLCFDPTMKQAIDAMAPAERDALDAETRDGWRLFHLFPVNQIVETAARHGLLVCPQLPLDSDRTTRGVITYRGGKKMPTACVVLEKR